MILGLCGKPQSGKTEVRRILEEHYDYEVVCSKNLLYSFSSLVTGLPEAEFYDPSLKNKMFRDKSHRQITGTIGNAIEELFGDNYLVERALLKCSANNQVVDSLRKTQTVGFKGYVVEVISDKSIETGNSFDEYDRSNIAYKLYNYGSLEVLANGVEHMLNHFKTVVYF
jgi:hypothetical protein